MSLLFIIQSSYSFDIDVVTVLETASESVLTLAHCLGICLSNDEGINFSLDVFVKQKKDWSTVNFLDT
jgi:hypothetical protein